MKKILIIDLHCDALLPSGVGEFGGGNTYSKSVISSIINSDITCLYITRKKIKNLVDKEKIGSNITYIRIETSQTEVEDKDTLYKYKDEICGKIQNILKKYDFNPDLIHSMYWSSGIVAKEISSKYNIPFIHTVLSNGRRKLIQSGKYEIADIRIKYEENCFENAKFIICSSAYELEDMVNLYNIPRAKLILAGLIVDDSFKTPSYDRMGNYKLSSFIDESACYVSIDAASHNSPSIWWNKGAFLYYGRLHPDKGIIQIINSWLELKIKYPDFPMLWIAGGSPEQIYKLREQILLKDTLEYYENSQDIIWWGRLNAEGLSTLLLKSLALVTHSRYESGGLMILEAMAQGIPVIATPFGYAHEYIKDWNTGFIVNYDDCSQLKRRMLHFYNQPFLTSVLGENAKELYKVIEKNFNFREKHLELYHGNCPNQTEMNYSFQNYNCLTYPIAEYLPTDTEILIFFKNYMNNNSWRPIGIPILKSSIDFKEYHIWIIEYQGKEYECFRWKTHINTKRILKTKKTEYFILSSQLMKMDYSLYKDKLILQPLNLSCSLQLTIFPLRHKEYDFTEIEKNFTILFNSIDEKKCNLPTINFSEILNELQEMMHSYNYTFQGILLDIFYFLTVAHLAPEPFGVLPEVLTEHTILDNAFTHIGSVYIGPKSYFYALYLLKKNICSQKEVDYFLMTYLSKAQSHKNILLWLLCLKFQDVVTNLILYNTTQEFDLNELLYIKKLLK